MQKCRQLLNRNLFHHPQHTQFPATPMHTRRSVHNARLFANSQNSRNDHHHHRSSSLKSNSECFKKNIPNILNFPYAYTSTSRRAFCCNTQLRYYNVQNIKRNHNLMFKGSDNSRSTHRNLATFSAPIRKYRLYNVHMNKTKMQSTKRESTLLCKSITDAIIGRRSVIFRVPDIPTHDNVMQILQNAAEVSTQNREPPEANNKAPIGPPAIQPANTKVNWQVEQNKFLDNSFKLLKNDFQKSFSPENEFDADLQKRVIRFPPLDERDFDKILIDVVPLPTVSKSPDVEGFKTLGSLLSLKMRQNLGRKLFYQDWQEAENIMLEMKKLSLAIKIVSLSRIIRHFAQIGETKKAEFWFKEIFWNDRKPDQVTFSYLLQMYANQNMWQKSVALFEKMKSCGYEPDGVSFYHLLTSLANIGHIDLLESYFEEMKRDVPKKDIKWIPIYKAVITCHIKIHSTEKIFAKIEEFFEISKDLENRPVFTALFHIWMQTALRVYRPQVALELYDFAVQNGVRPDAFMLSAVIGALGLHPSPDSKFIDLVLEKKGFMVEGRDCVHLAMALKKAYRVTDLLKLFLVLRKGEDLTSTLSSWIQKRTLEMLLEVTTPEIVEKKLSQKTKQDHDFIFFMSHRAQMEKLVQNNFLFPPNTQKKRAATAKA